MACHHDSHSPRPTPHPCFTPSLAHWRTISDATSCRAYRHATPVEGGTAADDECAICLGGFEEGEEMSMLVCSHVYHKRCITQWLLGDAPTADAMPTCPLCKAVPLDLPGIELAVVVTGGGHNSRRSR